MDEVFERMEKALKHLRVLHEVFTNEANFCGEGERDFSTYKENEGKLAEALNALKFGSQLYDQRGRQMILADLFEYIFLGRGYYSMSSKEDKANFIRAILHFVNLLMCYDTMTVSSNLRRRFLEKLGEEITGVKDENDYTNLMGFEGRVGFPKANAPKPLNTYFDSLLPKTAGGLWHELLVYVFLLRSNCGYIIPLLLSQRLISLDDDIIPPDFLILTKDKRLYGIEVGTGKERQSGSFALQTAIPSTTINTGGSRTSDRCPICERWISFCPHVINHYCNLDKKITPADVEARCLEECSVYLISDEVDKKFIACGGCPYTKYSRKRTRKKQHTHHAYADGHHYHYRCVLENVSPERKKQIVEAKDTFALKTHYPHYSGIEELTKDT